MYADVTAELHSANLNVMVTTADEQEGICKEGPQLVIRQGYLASEPSTSRDWILTHYRCDPAQ